MVRATRASPDTSTPDAYDYCKESSRRQSQSTSVRWTHALLGSVRFLQPPSPEPMNRSVDKSLWTYTPENSIEASDGSQGVHKPEADQTLKDAGKW